MTDNIKLIEAIESDIYCEIDGYYVFSTLHGFLTAGHLRLIADELDKRNKEVDQVYNEYLINSIAGDDWTDWDFLDVKDKNV